MKVLITGCTSRQANPDASFRDVTFAFLIAKALREAGHEVEHRNPSLTEDVSGFDMVIVGMAPLHGLGSNRTYGALSAIMRTWGTGKLVMMLDDHDTGKIFSGLRTMVDNPARLTKPFFAYKLEHALASEDPWKSWLEEGVKMLNAGNWPATIAPILHGAKLPNVSQGHIKNLVGIDPTTLLDGSSLDTYFISDPRRDDWLLEGSETTWTRKIAHELRRPVFMRSPREGNKFVSDIDRLKEYTGHRGVIVPPLGDGSWWTSRLGYAATARCYALTDWRSTKHIGDAWNVLPSDVEGWSDAEIEAKSNEQYTQLFDNSPSTAQIAKTLEELV